MNDYSVTFSEPVNPWVGDDKFLGPFRSALALAERTGHLQKYGDQNTENIRREIQETAPSLKLFSILKQRSRCQIELARLNLEIQCRLQDKETSDITHFDELTEKINRVCSLNSHIQSIIDSKERLINRLQQPFVGDFIRLEARFHKYASELLPQIAPLLGDLNTNLENIMWMKSMSFSDKRLDNLLSDLSTALASLQSNFQALCQLRQSISNLYQQQTDLDISSSSQSRRGCQNSTLQSLDRLEQ